MHCCVIHAVLTGLMQCRPATLTVMVILYKACTVCRPQTLSQLMPICNLLHGPLQHGCMHAWQHMWSSHIDHQCMCQSCCRSSRSVLLFLPVLTLVHRVCRMCAGLEVMLLLLARMAHALENGTASGCRLRRRLPGILKQKQT